MSSYWSDAPYRQRAKPVLPPTTKAPALGPIGSSPGGNPFAAQPSTPLGGYGGLGTVGGGFDPAVLQQVFGVVNPQLQSAADIINRRSQIGTGYISGLTNFLQQEMGGISGMVSNAYGGPIKLARKVADWAGGSLTGAGQAQTASVAKQMASAGPLPTSSDLNLTQEGKGAGGAAYGTGIAELDNLIASRAAAQTRAALEPSFAAMTGQQEQSMLASQLARQLSDQQSSIMGTVPQLLLDLQNRADTKAADTRDYTEKVREFNVQAGLDKAKTAATAGSAADKQAYEYAKTTAATFTKNSGPNGHVYIPRRTAKGWEVFDAGSKTATPAKPKAMQHVTINGKAYTFDPNTGAYKDPKTGQSVVPTGKPGSPPKVNMPLSRARGEWVDASGNRVPGLAGKPPAFFKPGTAPGAGKPPTDNQLNNMIQTWYQGKTSVSQSTTGDKTTTTSTTSASPISYQQALKKVQAMYKDPAARAHAVQLLESAWQRGEGGRPYLNPGARQTLANAKLRPAVHYVGIDFAPKDMTVNGRKIKKGDPTRSIPYLTADQVKALKAANMLPPGAWAEDDSGLGHVYIVRKSY
jgi:hypothetical protein